MSPSDPTETDPGDPPQQSAAASADRAASDAGCSLCGLPLPAHPIETEDVDGYFCCAGCLAVQRALGDVGDGRDDTKGAPVDIAASVRRRLASRSEVTNQAIETPTEDGNGSDREGGRDPGGVGGDRGSVEGVDGETVGETVEKVNSERVGEGIDGAVDDGNSLERTFLAVDGMHCTTCEAFLEARAEGIDGVETARASYAGEVLCLEYDPDAVVVEDLPSAVSGYGYRARPREEAGIERRASDPTVSFLVGGGLFGMMVMVWYALFLYPTYFGFEPIVSVGEFAWYYVIASIWVFTTFVLFYTGWPILRGAVVSLRAGAPNMDLLIAVAAVGAYAYSVLAAILGRSDLYFDVSVAIILVVTAGTYYEDRIKHRALSRLSALAAGRVESARRALDGSTVAIEDVRPGEALLVRPGERIPLDGTVSDGRAAVDESLVTGESIPVTRAPGDPVRGGTVVTDAPITIEVADHAESTLDRIVELLWAVQSGRPGVQRLADRLATIFVPLVLVLATVSTVALVLTGASLSSALLVGLTVVIVTCPCALGLATPLAIAAGVQAAARRGIVVASAALFEAAPDVDVVVLDKTGTLTAGEMRVVDVFAEATDNRPAVNTATTDGAKRADGDGPSGERSSTETVLAYATAIERYSNHPVATAVVECAAEIGPIPTSVDDGRSGADDTSRSKMAGSDDGVHVPGNGLDLEDGLEVDVDSIEHDRRGLVGDVSGRRVAVGHPDFLRERGYEPTPAVTDRLVAARASGDVPVAVGWEGRIRGGIVVGDIPRAGVEETIQGLSVGRTIVVLTGDEGAAADRFRELEGVDEVFAGVPPAGKAETVRRLQARGTVAMVGDGSNDAPALATADVGIAMADGTELAADAADAVILSNDLDRVEETFAVARGAKRRIRENLAWAFLYNVIAIPLAISGLLNPLLAALAMATSSIVVVSNSSRSVARARATESKAEASDGGVEDG